ncbi:hypothetical protein [Bosea sp. 47.2.35]|uniref:hypothetical protein n=1 Tax=Bosea sp. 47.2.35 TaxID=2969304 RepID=UPI00215014B8|nr:hypothetical protein [Bosea sp. 47.2.35]MCR4524686.1 hypothetical protein [Bosea sp. 47.2.35]
MAILRADHPIEQHQAIDDRISTGARDAPHAKPDLKASANGIEHMPAQGHMGGSRVKQRNKSQMAVVVGMLVLFLGLTLEHSVAHAQSRPSGAPSATLRIRQLQVAFIGSGAIGGGTLRFRGGSYDLTVGGLGFGGIGASRLTATGSVYGLSRVEDIAGAYVQIREGWAIGAQGRGTLWLRNAKGVTMRLATQRKGLQLSLGADGVLIGFKQ